MGSKTLASTINVTIEEAVALAKRYKTAHPKMTSYCLKLMHDAEQEGHCESVSGRRRPLKGQFTRRVERVAVNTTIQGSAADLVKAATVDLDWEIASQFDDEQPKPRLIHHIHDELIYECPIGEVDRFSKMMKHSMIRCDFAKEKFNVNFIVKIRTAKSWDKL